MTHDLALLPTQSLVSGVIGAIGVASVIGVAAKPATCGKAKEYAGYARYARRQKSSEQSKWAANSVPETRIRSFARSPPHCTHQARYRTGSFRGKSLPIGRPVSEQAHLRQRKKEERPMSTDFRTEEKIQMADLFDGRLERLDIREHVEPGTTSEKCRCLTDGRNYLWAYSARDGLLSSMSRYGQNAVGKILTAVAETFDTDIYSEHEPQFWGFANKEEWDLAWSEMDKKAEDEFHVNVIAYVKGEPNNIKEGTVGMEQAKLAINLVAVDPHLSMAENKRELLDAIGRMYYADKTVTLREEQIELVKL